MKELDDNIIPVDEEMERFENHLLSHDRVILSAKFGDGKTFFLNKFKEKCKNDSESPFVFITLYPVNYQVLENKDIFDLVKQDILLQLLQQGIIDVYYGVTERMAFEFYVQNHFCSVAESFLKMLKEIDADDNLVKALFDAYTTASWIKELRSKVEEFIHNTDRSKFLDDYLAKFDESSVYENDVVTKIIRDNIKEYQIKKRKKIVLVIEDMDRLDPAHLFRILNVFSAQMDYGYRCFIPNNDTLVGNKFGVSNVVFVMHERNTKAIFHHFYGDDADYRGYMSKFYNKEIFHFSLQEEKKKYALSLISFVTGVDVTLVNEYFSADFLKNKTLRELKFALDKVEEQLGDIESKLGFKVNVNLLKLFIIAKRLGVGNDTVIKVISQHFINNDQYYKSRLLSVLSINKENGNFENVFIAGNDYDDVYLRVLEIDENGYCIDGMNTAFSGGKNEKSLESRIMNMLKMLGY